MKYYAVIDTNVLVSAMLKWDSPPGHIMELVFNDCIVTVLNDEILNEYVAVLSRNKFHFPQSVIDDVINDIISKSIFINANPIDIELPDEKDRVFYEIVIEKRSDGDAYLVTGNIRRFPKAPFIVTPREMLDIILG